MGKLYTFISKDKVNTKVKTQELDAYLQAGWTIGNWNQEELNKKSGAGVKKFYKQLESSGLLEEYKLKRDEKISKTLRDFWENVDEEYIVEREKKKELSRQKWSDADRKLYSQRMSESAKNNRKTISDAEYKRRAKIANETRKLHGTTNTSISEDKSYKILIDVFGKDDVIRQYHDDKRYPFACDFYIKSLDLFIECNYSWTHGKHRFNPEDDEDIKTLCKWKEKASTSKYVSNAIHTWTVRDLNKYNTAKINKINYKIFYNLEEFNLWVNEEIKNEI